jgi:RNA polymerase subunit RPABC4/transcription elongation factor Spt4
MAKGHRGKGIKTLFKRGRDTCPVCSRTGVKVLYEVTIKEKTVKVCKTCKAALANRTIKKEADAPVTEPAAAG